MGTCSQQKRTTRLNAREQHIWRIPWKAKRSQVGSGVGEEREKGKHGKETGKGKKNQK